MSIKYFLLFLPLLTALAASQTLTKDQSPEAYFQKGLVQYKAEMWDYAIFSLRKALELDPKRFEAANILAQIYLIKNNRQAALDYWKLSLGINDAQADPQCSIGELYEFFNERDIAFKHFLRCVEIDPNHVKGNVNLVRHYIRQGKKDSAQRHLSAGVKAGEKKSKKIVEAAKKAEKKKNFEKALSLYQEALRASPGLTEVYLRIHDISRMLGRPNEAAQILEKLKFVRPDFEKAYILLAEIYYTQRLPGKRKYYLDLALRNLESAQKINPKNADTYYSLSEIYRFMGDRDRAEEMIRKGRMADTGKEKQ